MSSHILQKRFGNIHPEKKRLPLSNLPKIIFAALSVCFLLKNNFILKDMLVKLSESRKAGSNRLCSFCILHSKEVEATQKCITCLDLLCSFCVRHRHVFTRQNAYYEIVLLEDYLTGKCTVKKNFEVICERHNENCVSFARHAQFQYVGNVL